MKKTKMLPLLLSFMLSSTSITFADDNRANFSQENDKLIVFQDHSLTVNRGESEKIVLKQSDELDLEQLKDQSFESENISTETVLSKNGTLLTSESQSLSRFLPIESVENNPRETKSYIAVAEVQGKKYSSDVEDSIVKLKGHPLTKQKWDNIYLLKKGEFVFHPSGPNRKVMLYLHKEDLTVGEHQIEISAKGFETISFMIQVTEPKPKEIKLKVYRMNTTATKDLEISVDSDDPAASEYLNKNRLKISINGEPVDSKDFKVVSSSKKIVIKTRSPRETGELTVRVECAGYETKEIKFEVSKVKDIDVVSSPSKVVEGDTEYFNTKILKGEQISYRRLAFRIHFENGKAEDQVSQKQFDLWNIKLDPEERKVLRENFITVTIGDFSKQIPIELIMRQFKLKSSWVNKGKDIEIEIDPSDTNYSMLTRGDLVVKAGADKENLKILERSRYGKPKEVGYYFGNDLIKITNLSQKEGKVYVEISHPDYDKVLYEVMVSDEEPKEFLEIATLKQQLQEEITKAENADLSNKTQESVENLKAKIKDAKKLISGESGKEALETSIEELKNAVKNLKEKSKEEPKQEDPKKEEPNIPNNSFFRGDSYRASVRPDPLSSESIDREPTPLAEISGRSITRKDVVLLIEKYFEQSTQKSEKGFSDVEDKALSSALESLSKKGIFAGVGNGKFMPNKELSRQEFASVLHRIALYLKKDFSTVALYIESDESAWAKKSVAFAVEKGLLSYEGKVFGSKQAVSYEEVEKALKKLFEK